MPKQTNKFFILQLLRFSMLIEDVLEHPPKGITLIYGPAATGKTTLCLQSLQGRSIYISTNKNFSIERLRTMRADADALIERLVLFEPDDLVTLEKAVQTAVQLSALADIIVVDNIATHIRPANKTMANLALHRMLNTLKQTKCPVLLTSEVYDYIRSTEVKFVGGEMLRLAADTIIELHNSTLTIRKHAQHTGRARDYRLTNKGLELRHA
jgi:RecA/RadA recombinase